jgi:hypothetical protein
VQFPPHKNVIDNILGRAAHIQTLDSERFVNLLAMRTLRFFIE